MLNIFLLKFLVLFTLILPLGVIYYAFDHLSWSFSLVWTLLLLIIFFFKEKLILAMLGAKEVDQSDLSLEFLRAESFITGRENISFYRYAGDNTICLRGLSGRYYYLFGGLDEVRHYSKDLREFILEESNTIFSHIICFIALIVMMLTRRDHLTKRKGFSVVYQMLFIYLRPLIAVLLWAKKNYLARYFSLSLGFIKNHFNDFPLASGQDYNSYLDYLLGVKSLRFAGNNNSLFDQLVSLK